MSEFSKVIDGKIPEPGKLKARAWKKVMEFEPVTADGVMDVDGAAEIIALVYNVDKDTVLDTLLIEEIMPVTIECVRFVNNLVNKKLDSVAGKNVVGGSGQ